MASLWTSIWLVLLLDLRLASQFRQQIQMPSGSLCMSQAHVQLGQRSSCDAPGSRAAA